MHKLSKQLDVLEEENEILKNAAAYFAKNLNKVQVFEKLMRKACVRKKKQS